MTDRDSSDRSIIGGAGGNTSGTGGPDLSGRGEGAGAGAAGSGGVDQDELQTQARSGSDEQASSEDEGQGLSAGDDSVDQAIGGGAQVSGTGGGPALSGRSTSEGNAPASIALDPGDPGGMGGVRVKSGNPQGRPPGGVSPIDPDETSEG